MKFETYVDAKGEHRWRARASNGKIVADGAEGYASKRNVERALSLDPCMESAIAAAAAALSIPVEAVRDVMQESEAA